MSDDAIDFSKGAAVSYAPQLDFQTLYFNEAHLASVPEVSETNFPSYAINFTGGDFVLETFPPDFQLIYNAAQQVNQIELFGGGQLALRFTNNTDEVQQIAFQQADGQTLYVRLVPGSSAIIYLPENWTGKIRRFVPGSNKGDDNVLSFENGQLRN